MEVSRSDSVVFFGATGDLAYKQIFLSLQGLIRDGPNVPIIGVSRSGPSTSSSVAVKVAIDNWSRERLLTSQVGMMIIQKL